MGKKLLLGTVAAAGLSLGALSAQAADIEPVAEPSTWYVSLFGGVSFLEDVDTLYEGEGEYSVETDTGFIVGGALGTRVWDPVRLEVEVSYAEWGGDHYTADYNGPFEGSVQGHLDALFVLGNIWFDIDTGTVFRPYLGGGAGVAWADANAPFDGDDSEGYGDGEMGFAFQLGGGLQFDLAEHVALDIGYRFKGVLDVDLDDTDGAGVYAGADFYSHNIQGGLIFSF